MPSRDYTQELGIPSSKKTLPRPVTIAILAVVTAGISFGVVEILAKTKEHHAAERPVTPATTPVAEPAK